jgi:hypothetical protein
MLKKGLLSELIEIGFVDGMNEGRSCVLDVGGDQGIELMDHGFLHF